MRTAETPRLYTNVKTSMRSAPPSSPFWLDHEYDTDKLHKMTISSSVLGATRLSATLLAAYSIVAYPLGSVGP